MTAIETVTCRTCDTTTTITEPDHQGLTAALGRRGWAILAIESTTGRGLAGAPICPRCREHFTAVIKPRPVVTIIPGQEALLV